ncbi:hypothetical protein CA54_12630 [Symmachiella macrocystis]|uniref:Uncharacterized protein n=1 Tax=Symmachiella macrocystis TaxID=2527985 RepID=A0A5C6BMW1_9PLAN|nr:hypothetical protein CA54_12630 [Symmachiella macrocystis]
MREEGQREAGRLTQAPNAIQRLLSGSVVFAFVVAVSARYPAHVAPALTPGPSPRGRGGDCCDASLGGG